MERQWSNSAKLALKEPTKTYYQNLSQLKCTLSLTRIILEVSLLVAYPPIYRVPYNASRLSLPPSFLGFGPHSYPLYSLAPRHALAQRRKRSLPLASPRETCAAHANLGCADERSCCNLEVPSSRHSTRKNKLPAAQPPARGSRDPSHGAWLSSVRTLSQ